MYSKQKSPANEQRNDQLDVRADRYHYNQVVSCNFKLSFDEGLIEILSITLQFKASTSWNKGLLNEETSKSLDLTQGLSLERSYHPVIVLRKADR